MLVTSQAPLDIAGEQLFPLAPLPTPAADEPTAAILASDAVGLFVQRARAVNPTLTIDDRTAATIAEICRKLDGLPLAIELAAARTNILSPEALLARLSNRLQVLGGERRGIPDRLRTMRNAVAWSYDLLPPDEQALFRHMAVFTGGISLDAVEAVCPPVTQGRDAFDVLSALVKHNLAQPDPHAGSTGGVRFVMLETLRHFGLELLSEAGEIDDARLAHALHVVDLAEQAEPELTGPGQDRWLSRLEAESENIRSAIEWALASGHEELALRIGGAIWRFCAARGLASECRGWLTWSLNAELTQGSPSRARGLIGLGHLAEDLRDLDAAHRHFEEARDAAIATATPIDESRALAGLGTVALDRGAYDLAVDHASRALRLSREAGERRDIASALSTLATAAYYQGRLDDAERSWDESREHLAAVGDVVSEAIAASNLGALASQRGDLERAERLQQRALTLQRQLRTHGDLPYTLINLGEVLSLLGEHARADDAFTEAIAMLRGEGNAAVEGIALNGLARLKLLQGELQGAAAMVLESTRLLTGADDRRSVIENAELLAAICQAHGDHQASVELLAATSGYRRELDIEPTPKKQTELDALEAAARAVLPVDEMARNRDRGAQLELHALNRRITVLAREIVGPQQASLIVPAVPAPPPATDYGLTGRETEVLRLLADGHSTRAVADALSISPRTATTHITNILGKFGVNSRTAVVAIALREGLA
jgi:predicted ATPase/DNA-binding CsgD family transcriptional regulator